MLSYGRNNFVCSCLISSLKRHYASGSPNFPQNKTNSRMFKQNGSIASKRSSDEENKFFSVQEELLSNAIKENTCHTVPEWSNLKRSILEQGRKINSVNFDAKAIAFCISHKNLEAGKSYINFITSNNDKPNIATLGKYLRLYYTCKEDNSTLMKAEEEEIISIYTNLKKICPIFDSITAENVIHALSLTSLWRDCLPLLDTVKEFSSAGASTYSAIIKAAFLNKDFKLAWNLLDEITLNDRLPYPSVYHTWLHAAVENNVKPINAVDKLLNFFASNDIVPSKDVTDKIQSILKPFSYNGSYVNIEPRKPCPSCNSNLQRISLSNDEFEKLRTVFFDKVIVGKNVFCKSTPEELERFKSFISEAGSYDMVIDGLNVAYSAGNKLSPHAYGKMLSAVVHHFTLQSKKVLVLGRAHMKKWPREHLSYIKANADIFLAQNLSQDDPYLLYATMASGLGTGFLSRDFMRGHCYLLMDPNVRKIFRRWQQLHQHTLSYVEPNGKVHIRYPSKILSRTQSHRMGWHIPYTKEFTIMAPVKLDLPEDWLCLKMTRES